ncbi:MAG: hypothetical protein ACAH05_10300, partial [Methylophilus sp.]
MKLQHQYVIAELVARRRFGRKVYSQVLANGSNAVCDALFKLPTSKHPFHLLANLLPALLTHMLMYATVGDDF